MGLSYGLLRKWQTEAPFKKLVGQHAREFVELLYRCIEEKTAKNSTHLIRYLEEGERDELEIASQPIAWTELGDLNYYGEKIFNTLSSIIKQIPEQEEPWPKLLEIFGVLDAIAQVMAKQGNSEMWEELRPFREDYLKVGVRFIKERLESDWTDKSRRYAIVILDAVEKYLKGM